MTWVEWRELEEGERQHGTLIQWTQIPGYKGETWNPVWGCSKVSPGCKNCYAEPVDRIRGPRIAGRPFKPWTASNASHIVTLLPERLEQPLHWREPRAIFVNSLSDLFHDEVPDEFIDRVFATMALCPQHIFTILTKRPERMHRYFVDELVWPRIEVAAREAYRPKVIAGKTLIGPLANVWLGVSAERQHEADERIPLLLQTPAAKRFVSYEPALERVDFSIYLASGYDEPPHDDIVDWLIVGGESGPQARPFDPEWAMSTVEQGGAAGVPIFVKQLGARPVGRCRRGCTLEGDCPGHPWDLRDSHGGDWSEWPRDLRRRQFPIEVAP